MGDQSKDVYGFDEDPSKPAEAQAQPTPRPRRRPPKAPPAAERSAAAGPPVARESAPKGMKRRDIIAVVVLVAVIASFVTFMAIRQSVQRSNEQSAFEAAVGDYLFAPVEAGPGVSRPKAGKVVLVDMDKRAFDPFHLTLSEDLRAQSPEEVATVAQMRYTRQEVGRYEMGSRAIQLSCTMTVVDRASRTVIATRAFAWGKPPAR